ncbi:MAG: methyltransferase domain-containing protein [Bacteroidetes bacterium]|nr:methyltransferase domain-containing protein [Bacteroidota bacterium]
MASVKKIVSWIWPLHVKRLEGKITSVLEVSFEHGKKVLNAGDVNYSFGALHDVFRIALQRAKIIEHPPTDVLILGFGAGSIASIIVDEYGQHAKIYGVEADPVVIQIANDEFNLKRFSNLEMENVKAEDFIANNKRKFDLIAVDVFVEANVPESCKTNAFLVGLYGTLTKNGRVVFNEMPEIKFSDNDEFSNRFRNSFDEIEIHTLHVGGSPNRIFIGYRRK